MKHKLLLEILNSKEKVEVVDFIGKGHFNETAGILEFSEILEYIDIGNLGTKKTKLASPNGVGLNCPAKASSDNSIFINIKKVKKGNNFFNNNILI